MIREENEKAMKESKFVTNFSNPTSGSASAGNKKNNENNEPAPMKSGLDREHLVNAYGNVARGIKLPERKVKGLPVKGSRGAVTDAQIEAAKARVARWKLVNAAVGGGMNYQDAACGTDNMLNNEPCTSRELFERGVGPYANCQMATTVRRVASLTYQYHTFPGGGALVSSSLCFFFWFLWASVFDFSSSLLLLLVFSFCFRSFVFHDSTLSSIRMSTLSPANRWRGRETRVRDADGGG